MAKQASTDGDLLFELSDEVVAFVEGFRPRGSLAADPELLGAAVREWGLRRPLAIGSHAKGRQGFSAIEHDLGSGGGLVGDGCVRFAGIFAGERDGLGETVGACGQRHLDGRLKRSRQFSNRAARPIEGGEWTVGAGGIRLGELARPVVVALRCDMQFE